MLQPGMYWHPYHKVLCGWLSDPQGRIETIKTYKPVKERPIRLRLLKRVKGNLPEDFCETAKALVEADEAYSEILKAYYESDNHAYVEARNTLLNASKAYHKSLIFYKDDIERLHKKECPDCPWDGKTIFPNRGG